MSFYGSNGNLRGVWPQQNNGQSSEVHRHGVRGYSSNERQVRPQSGTESSYQHYHNADNRSPGYSAYSNQAVASAQYEQGSTTLGYTHPIMSATNGSSGVYEPPTYGNTLSQYNPQPQGWSNIQQNQFVSESQNMIQSSIAASPADYTSSAIPGVASRGRSLGANPEYHSNSQWSNDLSSAVGSPAVQNTTAGRPTGSGAEYVVPCPYGCGTVLTGVHAIGNMTRHLKSQNCVASGKDKTRHDCPVQGCEKRYIRSDGLKVHLRKRHNIAQASERSSHDFDENSFKRA